MQLKRTWMATCWLSVSWLAGGLLQAEEVAVGSHLFRIPDGYELQVAAGPDLVARPIAVARDEQGALYVTDSAGMSDRADKQLELKPHSVRKLIDRDGDGRYDESVLFAGGLMFPEGCLWYEGSLYVAAPPQIWKLTDTTGDGHADQREVWFDGKTLTGCGNDLHGPYLGPDGWFYWCKGAFAEQSYEINGRPFTTRSSHIFRSRPDGSRMEAVLTGGMDNPVNVGWLPQGDRFLSCTFFQHPENGRRDGLIHSIYGGVYGKKHDSIYEHPLTGEVMPVLVHMGAAAPCGLIGSSGRTFGEQTKEPRLFACYFNLLKVVEHMLIPDGSTYVTKERELLGCDHPDFHPTDVFEDADGSLLIVDTGGWYKICCPTSQLAKPDVLGGIYRLRKRGQPVVVDPLGQQLPWDGLDNLLTNLVDAPAVRQWVQQRAVRELRRHGAAAATRLLQLARGEAGRSPAVRQRILWTLAGIDAPEARLAVRAILASETDAEVGRVAVEVIGLWRDAESLDEVLPLIEDPVVKAPLLWRAAIEAAGRMQDPRTLPLLFQQLSRLPVLSDEAVDDTGSPRAAADRIHEHALIYAIYEILLAHPERVVDLQTQLQAASPRAVRGALVALEMLPGTPLKAAEVVTHLNHTDPAVRRTAGWVIGRHADWGSELVDHFEQQLLADLPPVEQGRLVEQLAQLCQSAAIQSLLGDMLQGEQVPARRICWQAMTAARLPNFPQPWFAAATTVLPRLQGEELEAGVAALRRWPYPKNRPADLLQALRTVGQDARHPDAVRLSALVVASPLGELPDPLLDWLLECGQQSAGNSAGDIARILGQAQLTTVQQRRVLPLLKHLGPFELPALLPAMRTEDEVLGFELLAALGESPGFRGLRAEHLQDVLKLSPAAVRAAAQPLLLQLNASLEEQTAQLEQLLAALPAGDVRRGHELFHSQKAKCITCHQRAYHGGRLGPDLTNIGQVRNTRDLLEAILFPSASLVRGYEPVTVALADGRILSGIIRAEDRESITLALDADRQQRFLRSEIEELQPSSVSLMPQGLDKLLSPQDFADLIAFLRQ